MFNPRINNPAFSMRHQTGALTQNLIAIVLIISGLVVVFLSMLPPSYNTDPSVIGQGKPVIAVIYDNASDVSLRLAEAFNVIRADYEGLLEFIAIDVNTPIGQQFLITHKVASANALYYSAEGKRVFVLHGPREATELRESIQQTLGL